MEGNPLMIRSDTCARLGWALLCLVAGVLIAPANADDLEERFLRPTMEDRQWTGPLFWLHGDESSDRLRGTLRKVAEGGNGSFTAESRPHSDWLGFGWYRDLQVCLSEARRLGLKMWIFDERWWPSGEVAGRVHLSIPYFSSCFKRITGQNYSEYLRDKRLEKAKQLLAETDLKIYQISHTVGYGDEKHFSKMFSKYVGCSPLKYKKNAKSK